MLSDYDIFSPSIRQQSHPATHITLNIILYSLMHASSARHQVPHVLFCFVTRPLSVSECFIADAQMDN